MKGALLAASATVFAAVSVVVTSDPVFAAPQEYSYELVQVASVGSGKFEVTVQLVRTSDDAPVTGAVISASGVDMAPAGSAEIVGKAVDDAAGQPGRHQFYVEAGAVGAWVLHLSAKVPGPVHVDRMFFSSVKWTQVHRTRGSDVVAGAVIFVAQ